MSPFNWQPFKKLLRVDPPMMKKSFSLSPYDKWLAQQRENAGANKRLSTSSLYAPALSRHFPKPKADTGKQGATSGPIKYKGHGNSAAATSPDEGIPAGLCEIRRWLSREFTIRLNPDLRLRHVTLGLPQPVPALLVFFQSQVNNEHLSDMVITPLVMPFDGPIEDGARDAPFSSAAEVSSIKSSLLNALATRFTTSVGQISPLPTKGAVIHALINGHVALFVEGESEALMFEAASIPGRGVEQPVTEAVVRGPHEAFNENIDSNIGLLRARLRSSRLLTEIGFVGRLAQIRYSLIYVAGLTHPALVREMRRRIEAIDVDAIQDIGLLAQYVEDSPNAFLPQQMITERPDRVAAALADGAVAVLLDRSPYALVAPVTFWSLLQSPEDMYLRWPYGAFARIIRFIATLITILLPGLYIAVTAYHPEMLPTELMLSTAAARERVPFPVLAEIIFLEFALELVRESGIRIPKQIGPTIGIVGAIIIGQAAVEAGLISPVLVVLMSVTALAVFIIPSYDLLYGIRLLRLLFVLAASLWGLFGIALTTTILAFHLVTLKSLGVPLLSPVVPARSHGDDVILRPPIFSQSQRPAENRPVDKTRQSPLQRDWNPAARVRVKEKGPPKASPKPGGSS
ncbi:spore germination protein [Heliobacterium gestii]|uniref:Spore germination protein n=1 Tax=Heliomicrobium gestii TaxID=2699 RepID=A0A845LM52_HELGE|nr:spore germination protein [Heliomicrobium gestii]MBM7867496.1 spore germination protein KA [Heliomicrobium gestii]MZP43956.1 spore germination protein [Heliomicrobium gestii]